MKRNIRVSNNCIYSCVAPLMILAAILGVTFRSDSKKNFYLPLGAVGSFMIIEKECNRRLMRKNILKKIQDSKNNK